MPAIYTKLLDIDKVDLIVSGYASTQIAAAMPIAIQRKKLLLSLFGTGVNDDFIYQRYFSMIPNGPTPKPAFTRGFFKVAEAQNPKPQTIALAYVDAEFGQNACEGARDNAKASGFKMVYDKSYPPATADFTPIVRAIQARNPDLLVICSYPLDTVGMIRTVKELASAEDVGRRDGRPAGHRVQNAARADAQRRRQFRHLAAGQVDGVSGLDRASEEISGTRHGGRHRSARLLHAGVGLCRPPGARPGHHGDQEHQ